MMPAAKLPRKDLIKSLCDGSSIALEYPDGNKVVGVINSISYIEGTDVVFDVELTLASTGRLGKCRALVGS